MQVDEVIARLRENANPESLGGMARYGIETGSALGVSMPCLRALAKEIRKNHALALELWETGIHEARILAGLIDDPGAVTEKQMEAWVKDFDSWDLCDQVCGNLFDKTPFGWVKALKWSQRDEEFVKRAGFALMAYLAVHNKKAGDWEFLAFMPLLVKGAEDQRNFVKKAVNWALRQIGKRNRNLNKAAIKTAKEISRLDSRAARWIASDALRELESDAVKKKINK